MFLDAVAAALDAAPRADHRHTIILMARCCATISCTGSPGSGSRSVSFRPISISGGDRHHDTILGPQRAARISPAASAERLGIRYTIHNDASVTPTRPLHLAHCAVNRLTASGRVLGEAERIPVTSALKAQTIDAAWQVFQEDQRGSITAGKLADLVVLRDNPLDDPAGLRFNQVLCTIRRGRCAFRAPGQDLL